MGFITKTIKFFAKRFVEVAIFVALILFMPSVPPYGSYSSYEISPPAALEGPLAVNHLLENAEKIFENKILGPESFADYNGELYVSAMGGNIFKIRNNELIPIATFSQPTCEGPHTEPDCGRPLGLRFDNHGNLIVADAYSGIWKVDVESGKKVLLVSIKEEIDGRPSGFPNSVAIAKNGDIYWTDSSTEYSLRDIVYALVADGTGRLMRYSPVTKKNEVLIDNIYFANGVALSENEDFVIVNEIMKSRTLRYYLKGAKKGTHDVFLDGIPGLPDNITPNKRGGFYIGLVLARDKDTPVLPQTFSRFPLVRKFVNRVVGLLDFVIQYVNDYVPHHYFQVAIHYIGNFKPLPLITPKRVTVLDVNSEGKVTASYHSLDGSIVGICEGHQFGDYMYLGSPYNPYIARVKLSKLGITPVKHQEKRSAPVEKPIVKPTTTPKPTTTTPKPTTTTPKPTTTTPKPTTTTPKPTTTTPKPTTTPKSEPTPKAGSVPLKNEPKVKPVSDVPKKN